MMGVLLPNTFAYHQYAKNHFIIVHYFTKTNWKSGCDGNKNFSILVSEISHMMSKAHDQTFTLPRTDCVVVCLGVYDQLKAVV